MEPTTTASATSSPAAVPGADPPRPVRARVLAVLRRLAPLLVFGSVVGAVTGIVFALGDEDRWTDWLAVLFLGMAVGVGELVSRYRDAPERALLTPAAAIYVGLNGLASTAALGLLRTFNVTLGLDDSSPDANVRWVQILVGGTGSMAFLRSALFTVRVADRDVAVGPSGFVQIILDACDRKVDRARAAERSRAVKELMWDVSFDRSVHKLHSYCVALMQNLTPEEGARVASRIKEVADAANVDDRTKALDLGLILMTAFGMDVLKRAVLELGESLRRQPVENVPALVRNRTTDSMRGVADIAAHISGSSSQEDLLALRSFQPDEKLPEPARALSLAYRIASVTGEGALAAALKALDERATPAGGGAPATSNPASPGSPVSPPPPVDRADT